MATVHNLHTQIVVAGGGLSGVCAALAAARTGATTILLQDRPVLGGNSSSEIRVHVCGADVSGGRPHAREAGILEELRLEDAVRNPQRAATMWDLILYEKVTAEPNITLMLNTACVGVEMKDPERINAVIASRESTEDRFHITAEIFIDCTGDARLGYEAGADFRIGREGPDEHDEPHAQGPDNKTMGASLMWQAKDTGAPSPFTPPAFARVFETCEDLPHRHHLALEHGHWWVELGGEYDIIKDTEQIRDELLANMMGVWDHVKNRCPQVDAQNWALTWFGFVPGKRESRRLLGDYILTENDLVNRTAFSDAVCHGGWSIDTHPPGGINTSEPPATMCSLDDIYGIPLRSLYSRNVKNLMMAGRNVSCTHMAMASTRVAATGAVMGQAAGTAAAMCIARNCLPRDIATEYITELQEILLRDDCYIPDRPACDLYDFARNATITASSSAPDCPPQMIASGVTRYRNDRTNQWASAEGQNLPQWIAVEFEHPCQVKEVQLTFDTGFTRPLTLTHSDWFNSKIIRAPQPETVRDYTIEGLCDGEWIEIFRQSGNYQRKCICQFSTITVSAIRVIVTAINQDSVARIYEIRVYGTVI